MSGNAQFDLKKVIEEGVLDAYARIDPTRFFRAVPAAAGRETIEDYFAVMPRVPKAAVEAGIEWIEAFKIESGEFRLPRHRIDIPIKEDELRRYQSNGNALQTLIDNAAKSLARSVAQTVFQNVIAPSHVPYYGLSDVGTGNGTFSRPLVAGSTTKVAGAFTTALIAAGNAGALKGRLIAHEEFNDGTPLVMFYPNVLEAVFEGREPSMTVPTDVRDCFTTKFGAVVAAGEMDEMGTTYAKSILSGNEETTTDFDLVCCNPNWFLWRYEQPPVIEFERKPRQLGAVVSCIHNGGLQPIPLPKVNGKIYKAMMKIADAGS